MNKKDNQKSETFPDDVEEELESCVICGKTLQPGDGRFRTEEGVFCTKCYGLRSKSNAELRSKI